MALSLETLEKYLLGMYPECQQPADRNQWLGFINVARAVFHKDLSALIVMLKSYKVARGLWRVIALDRSRADAAHWV